MEDAMLNLHKLITESTKVQASVVRPGQVAVSVTGTVGMDAEGRVFVSSGAGREASFVLFNPNAAESIRYSDPVSRGAPARFSAPKEGPPLSSMLVFVFPDEEWVCLFEVVAEE